MDRTHEFGEILSQRGGCLPSPEAVRRQLEAVDDFLEEAYKINSQIASLHTWLRSIRQSYLSSSQPPKHRLKTSIGDNGSAAKSPITTTTGQRVQPLQYLTNQDREQVDVNAKALLRELNARIQNMSAAESIRHKTRMAVIEKQHRGGALGAMLGAWAAGGGVPGKKGGDRAISEEQQLAEDKETTLATHRENATFYLRERLQSCMLAQTSMMELRIAREKEKQKSMLAKAGKGVILVEARGAPAMGGGSFGGLTSPSRSSARAAALVPSKQAPSQPEEELSAEQVQIFEKQNKDLLKQDEAALTQVRTAEQSLMEIAELQQELINNLSMQSEHIDQLVEDSLKTTENVGGGNQHLKKASEKPSTARIIFFSTSAFCAFLVIWDLIF